MGVARTAERRRFDSVDRRSAGGGRRRAQDPHDRHRDPQARVDRLRDPARHPHDVHRNPAGVEADELFQILKGELMRLARFLVLATLVVGVPPAAAQTVDERATAREVVKKRGDAVIMVLATIKLRINIGGREQSTDQATQANATILDSTGLTVLSLSSLQPDDVMSRSLSQRVAAGTKVDVTSEPSDIRMHLADGRELAAKLVLRDEDLDLA